MTLVMQSFFSGGWSLQSIKKPVRLHETNEQKTVVTPHMQNFCSFFHYYLANTWLYWRWLSWHKTRQMVDNRDLISHSYWAKISISYKPVTLTPTATKCWKRGELKPLFQSHFSTDDDINMTPHTRQQYHSAAYTRMQFVAVSSAFDTIFAKQLDLECQSSHMQRDQGPSDNPTTDCQAGARHSPPVALSIGALQGRKLTLLSLTRPHTEPRHKCHRSVCRRLYCYGADTKMVICLFSETVQKRSERCSSNNLKGSH